MSKKNGAGYAVPKLPTVAELRRAHQEGLPQTLLSGIEVKMRPVRPDKLLLHGRIPDTLTPLVMGMLFPPEKEVGSDVFPDEGDPVTTYLNKQRSDAKAAAAFVESVNFVCEAALVEPDIVPYLSFADRMWIFKLAWLPVEVLSTFRLQPARDVEGVADEQSDEQPAEPVAVR